VAPSLADDFPGRFETHSVTNCVRQGLQDSAVLKQQGLDSHEALLDPRETLRVDAIHFGHARIGFRVPRHEGGLVLDQGCLSLLQGCHIPLEGRQILLEGRLILDQVRLSLYQSRLRLCQGCKGFFQPSVSRTFSRCHAVLR
jgi:hypothetical protein